MRLAKKEAYRSTASSRRFNGDCEGAIGQRFCDSKRLPNVHSALCTKEFSREDTGWRSHLRRSDHQRDLKPPNADSYKPSQNSNPSLCTFAFCVCAKTKSICLELVQLCTLVKEVGSMSRALDKSCSGFDMHCAHPRLEAP